jgi:hypothetical protein
MLNTFDAPEREFCTVRRSRTNTPLQALALLNDPTYVEAARVLAERVLRAKAKTNDRLNYAFRVVTGRQANAAELGVLQSLLARQAARFKSDDHAARELVDVGESKAGGDLKVAELASWTMLASTLLNLDETIPNRGLPICDLRFAICNMNVR